GRLIDLKPQELGLMLDIGRKYFPPSDLFALLDQMRRFGFNLLHLHFSENERFGLQSDFLKSDLNAPVLSKSELTEIVDYATAKGISVMGELGMPGHMGAILRQYPEFRLISHLNKPFTNALDVTNEEAVALCQSLIQEFYPYFNATDWHLGGDEYVEPYEYSRNPTLINHSEKRLGPHGNAKDAKLLFLNGLGYYLLDRGLKPRVWSDDVTNGSLIQLSSEFTIDWWSDQSPLNTKQFFPGPDTFAKRGYHLVNCGWTPCYFVLSNQKELAPGFPARPDLSQLSEPWSAKHLRGPATSAGYSLPDHLARKLTGVKLQVWCDQPEVMSPSEVIEAIKPQMEFISHHALLKDGLA
ncbi:MAG: family 20 glycosylhydrolase, partial [Limnobacter sp.]|nr:family 20 glycosylhydrolase [Limnobacter sp.]